MIISISTGRLEHPQDCGEVNRLDSASLSESMDPSVSREALLATLHTVTKLHLASRQLSQGTPKAGENKAPKPIVLRQFVIGLPLASPPPRGTKYDKGTCTSFQWVLEQTSLIRHDLLVSRREILALSS